MSKEDLRSSAAYIRQVYLKKPTGSNVAIAKVYLADSTAFCVGATSKGGHKSPIPKPKAKSEGGYFEPVIDSRTGRLMDTDAEYKVLSEIAKTLEMSYGCAVEGSLYLYSELQPCESCNGILEQFQEKFPNVNISIFWDLPYP
ncbi:MAG: hypothetical protein F6K30_03135 [Cyanothece sp. SIO2G6]|nr:hypothetical protein [Cyanothece sp. SIO2G6]